MKLENENEECRVNEKIKLQTQMQVNWGDDTIHSLQVELHKETYINSKSLGS